MSKFALYKDESGHYRLFLSSRMCVKYDVERRAKAEVKFGDCSVHPKWVKIEGKDFHDHTHVEALQDFRSLIEDMAAEADALLTPEAIHEDEPESEAGYLPGELVDRSP